MKKQKRKCSYCRYWELIHDEEDIPTGLCRRHPPVIVDKDMIGMFPVTYPKDWCGEYTKNPAG